MSQQTLDAPTVDDTDIDTTFESIIQEENKVKDDDADDHERMSHYVNKEDIVRAATVGAAVYAICGKKWKPSKNPENYPICGTCKEIYQKMRDE